MKALSLKNRSKIFLALAVLGAAFASPAVYAAKFANQFTEFELPPGWGCNLEGAEWVCQNTDPAKKKEAIIVLAAKLKGDQDSIDQYLTYLKATKTFTSVTGKPMKSEPKYAKTVNINNQAWVDALHLESEIPGFFTRYLATVKEDIGVLVTYSVAKPKFQDYRQDFENMVNTIKVFRKQGGINVAQGGDNGKPPNITIPTNMDQGTVFNVNPQGGNDTAQHPRQKKSDDSLLYIVGGAAVVAILILRKKKR